MCWRHQIKEQFIKAMKKEVLDHESRNHWELVPWSQVPNGTVILPAVWSMQRKQRILTNVVYKWKARLNVHGGKQIKNVHYGETFSPLVRWSLIRLFLILAAINWWKTRQVDFVLVFPQANIATELFMEIPRDFEHNASRKTHCLKLKKNLYGQKQASQVWNKYLHKGLIQIGFKQSKVDESSVCTITEVPSCYAMWMTWFLLIQTYWWCNSRTMKH